MLWRLVLQIRSHFRRVVLVERKGTTPFNAQQCSKALMVGGLEHFLFSISYMG